MSTELRVIAGAVGKMMASANAEPEPELHAIEGSALVAQDALAGVVVQFTVGTPFGFRARVTVARADGMFGEAGHSARV